MPISKIDSKKDGLQGYRVRINYTDQNGEYKRIERTVYGKAEAQAEESRLLKSINEQSSRMTVSDLYALYMRDKKADVRETTYDKVRRVCEHAILPSLGSVRVDKLTVPRLQQWKADVSGLDLKLRTKQNYYKELSAFLNYAVRSGYLKRNPLPDVGQFREVYFEKPQEKIKYYTAEEYLRFSRAARQIAEEIGSVYEFGFFVFFSIAFYTGARKGEINALRWSDIEGNVMHIRRSIAQKLKGDDRETPPKNASSFRDLVIPAPLLEILSEHRERQSRLDGFSDSFRVCGGPAVLRDTSIENHNQTYSKAAGLPHITIHDFRHTHASLLCNEGINIQEIARRLGHSNVQITWNTYSHLYPREEERAVSVLDKIR